MFELADNKVGIADICCAAVGSFLAVIAVSTRLSARYLTGKPIFGLSDVMIVGSLVVALGLSVNTICSVVYGGSGFNTIEVAKHDTAKVVLLLQYLFAQNILWATANTLIRISILLLYLDLFPLRGTHKVIYSCIGLQVAYWIEVCLLRFLLCTPVNYSWITTKDPRATTCREAVNQAAFANGIVNIVLDFSMVAIPMPILWSLRMKTSKKIGLSLVFSLGVFICVLSILRVTFLQQTLKHSDNRTYIAFGSLAILEPLLGIVGACLPFFRPVLFYFFPGIGSGSTNDDEYTYGYGYGYSNRPYGRTTQQGSSRALRELEEGWEFPFESTSTGEGLGKANDVTIAGPATR